MDRPHPDKGVPVFSRATTTNENTAVNNTTTPALTRSTDQSGPESINAPPSSGTNLRKRMRMSDLCNANGATSVDTSSGSAGGYVSPYTTQRNQDGPDTRTSDQEFSNLLQLSYTDGPAQAGSSRNWTNRSPANFQPDSPATQRSIRNSNRQSASNIDFSQQFVTPRRQPPAPEIRPNPYAYPSKPGEIQQPTKPTPVLQSDPHNVQRAQNVTSDFRSSGPGKANILGRSRSGPIPRSHTNTIGSQVSRNNAPIFHLGGSQLFPYPTSSRRIDRQPVQQATSGVQDQPSLAADTSAENTARPLQNSPFPAKVNPSPQSFFGINEILSAVESTIALTRMDLNSLQSKDTVNAPGLAGRGDRLWIIHCEARIAGLEHFMKHLAEATPQLHSGREGGAANKQLPQGACHKIGYRLNLSFGHMQLGAATMDLIRILEDEIRKVKIEKKRRSDRAEEARINMESAGEIEIKEKSDLCRAWIVEVAKLGAWHGFLQHCLDGLVPRFVEWEEKARVEQLKLPLRG
ncbi:hypothetical protein VTL71DRAFT_7282 [Oculimacula yallundae]|uniref:Uncharacterized protein n=1 Tax=Oculimacula yallundae TaxID=86028 RepID=A0ABR4BW84_9HELO